jgi:hypothetical protein
MNEIIKKNGINYGVILGILGIVSHTIVYLMGGITKENAITGGVIQIVFWLAYLILRLYQCVSTKKQLGFVTLKDLFTTLTITVTIGIVISQIYAFLLNNYIDPAYGSSMNEFINSQQVEAMKVMKGFMEVSKKDIKEVANVDNFSAMVFLKGTFFSILVSSVMNIILAAIFKSKPQENY